MRIVLKLAFCGKRDLQSVAKDMVKGKEKKTWALILILSANMV